MTAKRAGPFSLGGRLRSFRAAGLGLKELLAGEHNAWIHAAATLLVVAAGFVLRVSARDWCLLVLAMAAVWVAEALNTAFEYVCDVVSPEHHPQVKRAKDVAAGGVLLSAIGAAVVGLLVFLPYLKAWR